jgi:hypothetical protein
MRSLILVVGLIGLFLVGVFEANAADLEAKLDSKDGTSSFSIKDSSSVEVARINSVGNIQADGTLSVDGTGNSYLMGNLGIGDSSPASLLTVGSGDLFQVNSSGNPVKINNVAYSWPSAQGGASTVLTNSDGAGTLTWTTPLSYTINVQALTSSPADGATVYFGMLPKAPTTTANISKVYIRKAGTIKIAEIYCYSGTAGTNESWSLYIRKNNTTDYLIATLGVATNERVFSNTGLSIAVVAGDYIEIKGIQPTWATNPLTTIYGGYVYIE